MATAHRAMRTDPFTLSVPAGWQDRTVVTLTGPERDGFAPNLVVVCEPLCAHMGLGAYASGWVARLAEEVAVRELRPVEHAIVSGAPAQIRMVGWADAGVDIVQLAGLLVHGDVGYAIVATGNGEGADALESTFRDVLAGFAIDGAA